MSDPPGASFNRDFASQSSDQAGQYPQQAYSRYDAPEGNAYAQGDYATPNQAFQQDQSLFYTDISTAQLQHVNSGQTPSYHSFDTNTQAAWDWRQPVDLTDLPKPPETQVKVAHKLNDRESFASHFNIPSSINPLLPPPRPLPQRPVMQTGMKRKSDSELSAAAQQSTYEQNNPSKRRAMSRASSSASQSSPTPTVLADTQPSPAAPTNIAQAGQPIPYGSGGAQRRGGASKGTGPQGREIDVSEPRKVVESSAAGDLLPAGRVFPIQIGSALFRLSGASLCSDAPSYFSHFFAEQLHNSGGRTNDVRTLYIDRDPDTFRDIALHLQGYHIIPRDAEHFVKLFADAQFYSLPRLTKQLFKSDIFISIGGESFRIPRDTFSAPGDSPNYFSLGFSQWFSTPAEVFPGLDRSALLRPPSISPPSVPNKSGETFRELVKMLQGYNVEIRSEVHRSQLLRDARYFHLKGIEQRLVPHEISYNLKRQQSEILIRLQDIRQSGISFTPDTPSTSTSSEPSKTGSITYARPYTDDASLTPVLILETSTPESSTLHFHLPFPPTSTSSIAIPGHATFHADTLRRITSLFSVIASKLGLPSTQPLGLMHMHTGAGLAAQAPSPATSGVSDTRVRVGLDEDCAVILNGVAAQVDVDDEGKLDVRQGAQWVGDGNHEGFSGGEETEWIVKRAQWRVRVEEVSGEEEEQEKKVQVILHGVKIEAFTEERSRNASRGFLGGA